MSVDVCPTAELYKVLHNGNVLCKVMLICATTQVV